jgi:hypothetical protein
MVIAMNVVVRYANNFPGVRLPRAASSPLFAALFFGPTGVRDALQKYGQATDMKLTTPDFAP